MTFSPAVYHGLTRYMASDSTAIDYITDVFATRVGPNTHGSQNVCGLPMVNYSDLHRLVVMCIWPEVSSTAVNFVSRVHESR